MRLYDANSGLGFADMPTPEDDSAESPTGFMEQAGEFITAHKNGVIAACVGVFALAILGELRGRR